MRIAVLSDIHANLEALTACLVHVRAQGVERIVFLGDVVGYGADPGACLDLVRDACEHGAKLVIGNHDEAVGGTRFRLNETAEAAIRWTQSVLSAEQKAYLAALPLTIAEADRLYAHASAHNSAAFPYIHGLREALESLQATEARLTTVGHIHVPALYNLAVTGKVMGFIPIAEVPIPLSPRRRWLAVVGAVGQPRDGNPAASYLIQETDKAEVTFVRVPYDVERAAAKIRAAGLPESLWKRLATGR